MSMWISGYALLFLLVHLLPACNSFQNNLPAATVSLIQETILATNQGSANITIAHTACGLWESLLIDDSSSSSSSSISTVDLLSDEILTTCLVLYASCLVRTGQDDQAVIQYDKALKLQSAMTKESLQEAVLGRGRALQRLLKYDEARDQFMVLGGTLETACCGAATCALREGNTTMALQILNDFCCSTDQATLITAPDAAAMRSTLELLLSKSSSSSSSPDGASLEHNFHLQQISTAAATSLLYRWILSIASSKKEKMTKTSSRPGDECERTFTDLDLAKINISPFDDHTLIQLDDKVLLHKLLSESENKDKQSTPDKTDHFWPLGMVTNNPPDIMTASSSNNDKHQSLFDDEDALWIHKRRSGYGSHGNQVLNGQQAKKRAATLDGTSLLQRMVDPPLLVHGRKFSLRIYVACFPTTDPSSTKKLDVYISREGLLKLASKPVSSIRSGNACAAAANDKNNNMDMRIHMTNSGRESVMSQSGLDVLEDVFATNDWSYEDFWERIRSSVRLTLDIYQTQTTIRSDQSQESQLLSKLGIPKLLGFDFVVDSSRNVWLVEVNRFPGLEARDESDREVKRRVLRETWQLASSRMGLSDAEVSSVFGDLFDDGKDGSSSKAICLEEIL